MSKFFGLETFSQFVKLNSTVARLQAGSSIPIGGQLYDLAQFDIDVNVSGVGGLESPKNPNGFYYAYMVLDSGSPAIIGSNSAISPSGFQSYRKVGVFQLDNNSEVFAGYSFGSELSSPWESFNPFSGTPASITQSFGTVTNTLVERRRVGSTLEMIGTFICGVTDSNQARLGFSGGELITKNSISSIFQVGTLNRNVTDAETIAAATIGGLSYVTISRLGSSFGYVSQEAGTTRYANNQRAAVDVKIPIEGWLDQADWKQY